MRWTASQLADRLGARLEGKSDPDLEGVRTLADAGPGDLSFLNRPAYLEAARSSRAGALLVPRGYDEIDVAQLVVGDVATALAAAIELFYPEPAAHSGIHPTAVVGAKCSVDETASLGPYVVLGDGVEVGARSRLHAHVVVGDGCRIGDGVVLYPHVVLYPGVRIGAGSRVHAGTVLGADGFGYASGAEGHRKIRHVGDVEVGRDVEIGALSAADRAVLGTTRIGDGTKIDNLVQVGHNVQIGAATILCGQVGIAGSARLGSWVVVGGQGGIGDHRTVGDGARVASKSAVYDDVAAGETVAGIPATAIGKWRRQQSLLRRLEEIWRRLRALEKGGGDRKDAGESS